MKSSAIAYLKRSSFRIKWNLREVHKITTWKDGYIYGTKSVGYIICAPEYADYLRTRDTQVGPVSTRITSQLT